VWATYHHDLVDLDWSNPDVCWEFINILLDSVAHGFSGVRLDAFAYVWKNVNSYVSFDSALNEIKFIISLENFSVFRSTCVNQPQCKLVLALLRACLDHAGADSSFILPSLTNCTQQDNMSYLFHGAQLTYHLPLAALLLHTLYSGQTSVLTNWLMNCPVAPDGSALLNLAASHDGIGLTWCRGILDSQQVDALCQEALQRGGNVQTRQPTSVSATPEPWEICITSWSACAPADLVHLSAQQRLHLHVDRFMAVHSVVASLRGVPAFYFSLLMAGGNDHDQMQHFVDSGADPEACCLPRVVNRGRFSEQKWHADMGNPTQPHSLVLKRFQALFHARRSHKAFHPNVSQFICPSALRAKLPSELFVLRRGQSEVDPDAVICLTNFGAESIHVNAEVALQLVGQPARTGGGICRDLLSDKLVDLRRGLVLNPFQSMWLVAAVLDRSEQLMELQTVESDWRILAAQKSPVDQFQTTDAPAQFLGLDTHNPIKRCFRAISVSSPHGKRILEQMKNGTCPPFTKIITFVHHEQSIHKLKATQSPCLCFDTTYSAAEQSKLQAWMEAHITESSGSQTFNPCPYFDTALSDPPLTAAGMQQVCKVETHGLPPPLVIASASIRTLQTAALAFPDSAVQSSELLRPMLGPHAHSRRVSTTVLKQLFPSVDFSSHTLDLDELWESTAPKFESRTSIDARVSASLEYALRSDSKHVALVTHFTTLLAMLLDGDDAKLLGARSNQSEYRNSIIDCRLDPDLEALQNDPKRLGKCHSFSTILMPDKAEYSDMATNEDWISSNLNVDTNITLFDLFQRSCQRNPHGIALCGSEIPAPGITFSELERRSAALSVDLCDRGISKSSLIGVFMHRSVDTLVAMLAILRSGFVYFALHPLDSAEYQQKLLKLTSASAVISNHQCIDQARAHCELICPVINMDSDIQSSKACSEIPIFDSSASACCLFTSGSSGIPKGILLSHASFKNLMFSLRQRECDESGYPDRFGPHSRVLQLARSSFDIHFWEYVCTVCFGGTVVVLPASIDSSFDIQHVVTTMRTYRVNWCFMVPSVASLLLAQLNLERSRGVPASRQWNPLPALKHLYVGGEVVSPSMMSKLHALLRCVLHHCYGPAETTIFALSHRFQSSDAALPVLPLGRPYNSYVVDIVDDNGNSADMGELWISGVPVLQHYVGMTSSQMLAFVAVKNGVRWYKTGDQVRRLSGQLYFHGRSDRQIKLRGQRIELNALEAVLRNFSNVTAVAVKFFPRESRIIGYLEWPNSMSINDGQLQDSIRSFCAQSLPAYMVPCHFVNLHCLPRSANGKIDFAALPHPSVNEPIELKSALHVGIIGAGVAGILSAMACLRANLEFTIIDANQEFGGVWVNGTARTSSRLQQPSEGYCISGTLKHRYPETPEIVEHISQAVYQHGLTAHTQFGMLVTAINSKSNTGRLEVVATSLKSGVQRFEFDAVVSCVGQFHQQHAVTPSWASPQQLNSYIIQKHAFQVTPSDVQGRDVVIVGGGPYSIEMIDFCLQHGAKSVTLIARRMHPVIPRSWFESPALTRIFWSLASGLPHIALKNGRQVNLSQLAAIAGTLNFLNFLLLKVMLNFHSFI
jgi:non-ribosomal peptide synthetase component F/broad specificity phosphatase PhoE